MNTENNKLPPTITLPTKLVGSSLQDEQHTLEIQQSPLDGHQATPISFNENSDNKPWSPLINEQSHNPFSQEKKRGWAGTVIEYLDKHGQNFTKRIETIDLTQDDLNVLSKTLELSAKDGETYDKYLGAWRILSSEYIAIAQKYPQMARATQVARTLRRAFVHEAASARLNNSPGTALKALQEEGLLSDDYLKQADQFNTLELHKKIELSLYERGIKPCQYAQVVYFHGDLPTENHEPMDDDFKAFGIPEKKVAELLGIKA